MFGIGWSELLLIILVAVLVIGPKDIPKALYHIGRFSRRLQYMKFAMTQQFDDILRAGDIEELRKGVNFEAGRAVRDIDHERAVDEDSHTSAVPEKPVEGSDKKDSGAAP